MDSEFRKKINRDKDGSFSRTYLGIISLILFILGFLFIFSNMMLLIILGVLSLGLSLYFFSVVYFFKVKEIKKLAKETMMNEISFIASWIANIGISLFKKSKKK
jgi:hypothetical protein